jgi:glycosylphosphatidylinositol transamidase (GPIT) subunit GPI8
MSFLDGDYTNINRQFEVDYKYPVLNSRSTAELVHMKYRPHTLNGKKLPWDDQPYFFYATGHGGDYYFKIRER